MRLNTLATNTAALALYESFGLSRIHKSRPLKMDWALIDALPPEATPYVADVRPMEPHEFERLERECEVPAGLLADQSARPHRVLRTIQRAGSPPALVVFDPAFPGTFPLRVPDLPHALSLLRALRPHARREDRFILIATEHQEALTDALISVGAIARFEMVSMRGPIT
jgi:hypothetical protein